MGEFFKGWRRKTGLVTLVMVNLFACGWLRSFSAFDGLNIHTSEFTYQVFASVDYSIVWGGIDGRESKYVPKFDMWHTGKAMSIDDDLLHKDRQRRIRSLGFGVGDFNDEYYVG